MSLILLETHLSSVLFFLSLIAYAHLLFLSPQALPARRVVGVELNEQAVEDARVNAQLNG